MARSILALAVLFCALVGCSKNDPPPEENTGIFKVYVDRNTG